MSAAGGIHPSPFALLSSPPPSSPLLTATGWKHDVGAGRPPMPLTRDPPLSDPAGNGGLHVRVVRPGHSRRSSRSSYTTGRFENYSLISHWPARGHARTWFDLAVHPARAVTVARMRSSRVAASIQRWTHELGQSPSTNVTRRPERRAVDRKILFGPSHGETAGCMTTCQVAVLERLPAAALPTNAHD